MAVKVAGQWEIGWDTPFIEYRWWRHPLMELDVYEFYMSPVTGIAKSGITEYTDITALRDEFPDYVNVYVDESAADELPEFVHPENALYIIGRCSYSPFAVHFREGIDLAVKIPSIKNTGGFWGHQAATMVLYDRYLKERNS
jgi:hypothetical protein